MKSLLLHISSSLGCLLDNTLSGKDMTEKFLEKVNGRLKFLYRQSKYLNKRLRRMLCNTIIQPHFDYASSAWYPNLNKNLSPSCKLLKINAFGFAYTLEIGMYTLQTFKENKLVTHFG